MELSRLLMVAAVELIHLDPMVSQKWQMEQRELYELLIMVDTRLKPINLKCIMVVVRQTLDQRSKYQLQIAISHILPLHRKVLVVGLKQSHAHYLLHQLVKRIVLYLYKTNVTGVVVQI